MSAEKKAAPQYRSLIASDVATMTPPQIAAEISAMQAQRDDTVASCVAASKKYEYLLQGESVGLAPDPEQVRTAREARAILTDLGNVMTENLRHMVRSLLAAVARDSARVIAENSAALSKEQAERDALIRRETELLRELVAIGTRLNASELHRKPDAQSKVMAELVKNVAALFCQGQIGSMVKVCDGALESLPTLMGKLRNSDDPRNVALRAPHPLDLKPGELSIRERCEDLDKAIRQASTPGAIVERADAILKAAGVVVVKLPERLASIQIQQPPDTAPEVAPTDGPAPLPASPAVSEVAPSADDESGNPFDVGATGARARGKK